jgi:hypothetical protein
LSLIKKKNTGRTHFVLGCCGNRRSDKFPRATFVVQVVLSGCISAKRLIRMKRSLITTLIIGVAVALIVGALHATKSSLDLRLPPRSSSPD